MEKKRERCGRLVLVPCPLQGHINPMLQLGTVLHSKGFSITIAHTQFNSPNASNHPHFTFLPIPDNLSDEDIAGGEALALVATININCEAPLRQRLAQMMEQQEKHDEIVCIIYDGIMYFSEAVANHLKVPSIVLRTGSVRAGQVFADFSRLQAQGYIPFQEREMEKQGQRNRRLVLVPCPFQGHINPMLQLATILHSKGFSITIAHTQFNSPNSATNPDFIFLPIPDSLSDHDISSGDPIGLVTKVNVNCEAPLRQLVAQMLMEQEEKHGDKIACIIYDGFMHFSGDVANHLKLPSIIFRTFSVGTGLAHTAFPQLQAEGNIPLQDSKLEDPVPGLHPLRFKDLPISHFAKIEVLLQLIANSYNMRSSSAMIWNTMDFLEQPYLAKLQQHYQVPFFPIGPLHKIAPPALSNSLIKEDNSCITWLDKQTRNSVIYISMGSIASMDKKDLAEMAWGLANSNQPFLWVIRPGSIHGSEWIELLPDGFKETVGERGCIVKWAPQKEVLAHSAVGGFWSHCGWNSTMESICEGVPMICQPCFGDQRVNTRYLSLVWKVGLQLGNELERGKIERAVKRLMVDQEGEEMRQRAMDCKEKAELCMKEGGSSYKSINDLVEFILSF